MSTLDDVRQAIERHNVNAVRWYAAGDVDSLVSIFAEDAWQMPPNSPPLVSSFEDRGNYLVHWRQDSDKEWRVVADAPVSELPLQGTASGDA